MQSIRPSLGRTTTSALLAFVGGLVLACTSLAILFLPTLQTCSGTFEGTVSCYGQSYIAIGGNALGYTFLAVMLLAGIACAATFRHPTRNVRLLVRWLAVIVSIPIIIVAGWGFGFDFVPGTLILLVAALLT